MAGQVKTKHLKGCMCHANVIEVGVRNCSFAVKSKRMRVMRRPELAAWRRSQVILNECCVWSVEGAETRLKLFREVHGGLSNVCVFF